MQQLARREPLEPLGLHARRRGHTPAATERVLAVPDDRATHMRQMHTDLMGAAGAEADTQEIGMREAGYKTRVCHGMPATPCHRHALALCGLKRDRRLD